MSAPSEPSSGKRVSLETYATRCDTHRILRRLGKATAPATRLGFSCNDRVMARPNVFGGEFEYDEEDPEGYRSGVTPVGLQAGGRAITVKVYEIPPGQSMCPYHYEYEEEWLIVLQGAVSLRTPEGEAQLSEGEVVCFSPGPQGAHKVTNRSPSTSRVMMFSSSREPAVAVYPDSDKIGVWPGNEDDSLMLRRADGDVDYYQGER
jgi:uncharacterized cupin superfamily protein